MNRIFAYIVQRAGVVDDIAAELVQAAKKIDATQSPIAILSGFGADLDRACESLCSTFGEVWKVSHESLAIRMPNSCVRLCWPSCRRRAFCSSRTIISE